MCQSRNLTVYSKFVNKKSQKSVFKESFSGIVLIIQKQVDIPLRV